MTTDSGFHSNEKITFREMEEIEQIAELEVGDLDQTDRIDKLMDVPGSVILKVSCPVSDPIM